jgi:hypothetical protein
MPWEAVWLLQRHCCIVGVFAKLGISVVAEKRKK